MQDYKIIIIGTGFGGQSAAINLLKKGQSNFIMLERRAFMGGTWSQNTYPGAAVDVQSALYSISHEPYDWSQMFAEQNELREYTEHVIDKYTLREKTLTSSNVSKIQWNEDQQQWHVHLDGEEKPLVSQYVINASGPLSTPVIPDFKGKDSFTGKSFHTNDWDHNYDYKNKRVAIIGSGASAAQIIPEIAKDVQHLDIFQRSPHWVMPRADYVFKPWQRKLLRNKWLYNAFRSIIYWSLESRIIGFKYSPFFLKLFATNPALKQINKQIKDPELRKKVTPDYTIGCKRVIISDTLYPAYCKSNVDLHDKNDAIAEINASGIKTSHGQQVDLDLIIYSTGYDATDGVISYPVIGKDNTTLHDVWKEFPRAYLGTTAPNFPNLFVVTGPNTGIGHTSAIFVIEAQMNYIMKSIDHVEKNNKKVIEVTADAEEKYTNNIHLEMKDTVWHYGGCNSWYKSKSGHVIAMYPGFSFSYYRQANNFKAADHMFR